jgi:hypothetical protein
MDKKKPASQANGAGHRPEPSQSEPAPFDTAPNQQEIAALAYSLWEARGGVGGSPDEDWYSAEAEIRRRHENTSLAAA